jgi:hypothetical protein
VRRASRAASDEALMAELDADAAENSFTADWLIDLLEGRKPTGIGGVKLSTQEENEESQQVTGWSQAHHNWRRYGANEANVIAQRERFSDVLMSRRTGIAAVKQNARPRKVL